MLKQHLQQKLQQKLSPQQIQLIRLLELPMLELEDRIKHELEDNPALEEGPSVEDEFNQDQEDFSSEKQDEFNLDDYYSEDDIPEYKLRQVAMREERKEVSIVGGQSLNESLVEQLHLRCLTPAQYEVATYIIGNIDDDGYLRRDLTAISYELSMQGIANVELSDLELVLEIIQDLEPAGIGARSLQECLLLQLKRKPENEEQQLAIKILNDHFEAFTKKHYDKLIKSLAISEDVLKQAVDLITSLNPKPGNSVASGVDAAAVQITPDFLVEIRDGELILSMNNRNIPELRVSKEYANMMEDYSGNKANRTPAMKEAVLFVKQKLDSANWFIEAVRQRQETLRRTMEAIIKLQHDFFISGEQHDLKPMILKDVADLSGFDISTISRVSNSKYVQTGFGIFPLKFFFSEAMQTDSGEEVTTREVKNLLNRIVEQEDKHSPLTDEELSEALKQKGYPIARRTVAKYREQLSIPVARLRKEI